MLGSKGIVGITNQVELRIQRLTEENEILRTKLQQQRDEIIKSYEADARAMEREHLEEVEYLKEQLKDKQEQIDTYDDELRSLNSLREQVEELSTERNCSLLIAQGNELKRFKFTPPEIAGNDSWLAEFAFELLQELGVVVDWVKSN